MTAHTHCNKQELPIIPNTKGQDTGHGGAFWQRTHHLRPGKMSWTVKMALQHHRKEASMIPLMQWPPPGAAHWDSSQDCAGLPQWTCMPNDQLKSLCVTVERLLKAKAAAMTGPLVMSQSAAPDTTSPTTNMAATTGTTDKPSGYLPPGSNHNTQSTVPLYACKYPTSWPSPPVHFERL